MENPNMAGGGQQMGMKFYRFKQLLRRNWWLLSLTAAVGLAYQGWTVYTKPRAFESSAKLNVREKGNFVGDDNKFNLQFEQFVGTSLAYLKSDDVNAKVQERLKLEAPNFYGKSVELNSSVLPRSYVFTVTARSTTPEGLSLYADLAREAFVDLRNEQRSAADELASRSITEKIKVLEEEVAGKRGLAQKYEDENSMQYWAKQSQQATEYKNNLLTKREELRTELANMERLSPKELMNLEGLKPKARGGVVNPDAAGTPASAESPLGEGLYSVYLERSQELVKLQSRIKERRTVWKESHPRLRQLLDEEKEIQDAIKDLMQQNADQVANRIVTTKNAIETLDKAIDEQDKAIKEAARKDSRYTILLNDVKGAEEALKNQQTLQQNLNSSVSKSDIFVKMGPPSEAVEVPKELMKHMLIGLFGGLVLGFAAVFLRNRADDRLASSSEMMEVFNEPILGQIPDVMSTAPAGSKLLPLLQPDDERYSFAEAFRSLRSSLIFMPNQPSLQTLLVTSAIPNEGKSTITSNLGITMAAAGAKIVLVDADLRRGDLASLFDMDGRTGLSNVLRGEVKWEQAVQQTKYPNLTLLPRGPVTNQSSELLLLPSLEKMLDELKQEFDLVLFNTAPILATDDTSSLSPHFDGTLMVIRAQFTSARLTHNALNALYQRQVNVLGLILNCVDTEMPDYYYYKYPKYYAAQ